MPFAIPADQTAPQQLLGHLNFEEGLAEFSREIERYKRDYLEWPEFEDAVTWIFNNIELPKSETSRPGKMKLTVYQREMAINITNPKCKQLTILKAVQIGYSKALKAIYAYVVGYLAKRCAVAFPTKDTIKRFWKDEIVDMYRSVRALQELIRDAEKGTASDTMAEQRFINGAIGYFRSAFNEDDLQSFTSEINMADEVDREGWQPRAGTAGNKLNQFRNRGTDFEQSKLLVGSTPGVRHQSVIWQEWLMSDQRRLRVNCPHCGEEQVLRWGNKDSRFGFKYTCNEAGQVVNVFYRCDSAKQCRIVQDDRDDMVDAGRYVATETAKTPGNIGIHIPAWISPSPGADWLGIAQRWVNAQGDTERMKEFVCFWMAEPWDEFDSRTLSDTGLAANRRPYPAEVPDDVIAIVAGGDDQTNKEGDGFFIQASREIQIVGFNRRSEPRVIGHWVIKGEVGDPEADAEYRAILDRPYRNRRGQEFYVQAEAMDGGGHHPDATCRFAASFPKNRLIIAIRGASPAKGTRLPAMLPEKATKSAKGNWFWTVDTQRARDLAASKLVLVGDSAPMWPSSMPEGFEEKMTSEHQELQKNGGYWWTEKPGRRSEEEWMCFSYAFVAWELLRSKRPRRWGNLNLAAERLGIPDISHDPDTGELDYDGPDMSVMAVEARAKAEAEPKPLAPVVVRQPKGREQKPAPTMQPVMPTPVPAAPAVVQQQPRRAARIVRSSSIW